MARRNASPPPPYDQPCAHCGAPAGYGCIRPNGSPLGSAHTKRGLRANTGAPPFLPPALVPPGATFTALKAGLVCMREHLSGGVEWDSILFETPFGPYQIGFMDYAGPVALMVGPVGNERATGPAMLLGSYQDLHFQTQKGRLYLPAPGQSPYAPGGLQVEVEFTPNLERTMVQLDLENLPGARRASLAFMCNATVNPGTSSTFYFSEFHFRHAAEGIGR